MPDMDYFEDPVNSTNYVKLSIYAYFLTSYWFHTEALSIIIVYNIPYETFASAETFAPIRLPLFSSRGSNYACHVF